VPAAESISLNYVLFKQVPLKPVSLNLGFLSFSLLLKLAFIPDIAPYHSEGVKNQTVPQRQPARFVHNCIRVLNGQIACDTRLLMSDDSTTVVAGRSLIVLIAVIPTRRGFGEHTPPPDFNSIHSTWA
jgi:hypothetical protein